MKKRWFALMLALTLMLGACPAAFAVSVYDKDSGAFPEFDSAMGYYMTTTADKTAMGDNVVASRNYSADSRIDFDDCVDYVREYIDLLESLGTFEVARDLQSNSSGNTWTAFLRYTGSAPMSGSLKAMRADKTWPAWGEYHITVIADFNSSRTANRQCVVTVRWDSGLTPVGTDLRTPAGERLGVAEDSSTAEDNRLPDEEEPSNKPGEDWNGWEDPGTGYDENRDPGEAVTTPEDAPDFTVVLGIGYNKMSVGGEVVQVDAGNAEVFPVVLKDRTLVPVSLIVSAFGGKAAWDAATDNTTYILGKRRVEHVIGSRVVNLYRENGRETKTMEVPSVLMYDRTYVPVRYVLEGLGLWVGYEPTYQLVVVSTRNLDGEDLVDLWETQKLFASEEIPDTPRSITESYTSDGATYSMEVGEALSLYNSRQAIGTYYSYTWEIVDGGELVSVSPQGPTCRFYAKRPGVVTLKAHLDETVVLGLGAFRDITTTYTMTITITPATAEGGVSSLMTWQTCPACNGLGSIRVGSRWETCPTCLGQKMILQH